MVAFKTSLIIPFIALLATFVDAAAITTSYKVITEGTSLVTLIPDTPITKKTTIVVGTYSTIVGRDAAAATTTTVAPVSSATSSYKVITEGTSLVTLIPDTPITTKRTIVVGTKTIIVGRDAMPTPMEE